MTKLSDAAFALKLDGLQAGHELPNELNPADAADLALAAKMLQMKAVPSQKLMARLQSINLDRTVATGQAKYLPFAMKTGRQLMIGVALSLATLLTIALIYPPTRLAIAQGIETITFGMIRIHIAQPEATDSKQTGKIFETYSVIWKASNVEEVQAEYPKLALIPSWAPENFELQDFVAVYFGDFFDEKPFLILYEWQNDSGDWIQLTVYDSSCPEGFSSQGKETCAELYLETNAPIFVTVNGEQALIRKGQAGREIFTEPIKQWNPSRSQIIDNVINLYWETDKKLYIIRTASEEVLQEDLIRMLESIP